jgi:hypothetical protein
MAAIHRRVDSLLAPLRHSGVSALAEAAEARIQSAEDDESSPEDEERDPLAPSVSETPRERGFRQLKIVDLVVSGILKQELLLQRRNVELVRELRGRAEDADETGLLRTVTIVSSPVERPGREANLIGGRRLEAIEYLLSSWKNGVDETRRRLETDGD